MEKPTVNQSEIEYSNSSQTKGAEFEKVAFNFCKAATLMLLTLPLGRFALPFVAGAAGILFLASHFFGQKTTRCILQKPLYVGVFWMFIAGISLWWILK